MCMVYNNNVAVYTYITHFIQKYIYDCQGALNILDDTDNLILQILFDDYMKGWLEALVMLP